MLSTTKSVSLASLVDYSSGTEADAGLSGQAYVKLPAGARAVVREAMWQSFPDARSRRPVVVEMEVLVGSGRR